MVARLEHQEFVDEGLALMNGWKKHWNSWRCLEIFSFTCDISGCSSIFGDFDNGLLCRYMKILLTK